ncbi:GAF domain-containing protein [Streptomyces erythrochromogenes]
MDHAELLLRASEELAQTSGLEDVRRRLRDLFVGVGKPSYVGLLVAGKDELHRIADPDIAHSVEQEVLTLPVEAAFPSTRAMRERRAVFVPDREALVAGYAPEAVGFSDRMGFTTVLCLPLWGSRALLGVLAVCWAKRHEVGVTERATLTAASGYVAQAVERALYLDERISVAPAAPGGHAHRPPPRRPRRDQRPVRAGRRRRDDRRGLVRRLPLATRPARR